MKSNPKIINNFKIFLLYQKEDDIPYFPSQKSLKIIIKGRIKNSIITFYETDRYPCSWTTLLIEVKNCMWR